MASSNRRSRCPLHSEPQHGRPRTRAPACPFLPTLVAACLTSLLLGCGDDPATPPNPATGGSAGSGGAGGEGGGTVDCPPGQAPSFSEECVPVGIQDCADIFVEDDGLCHPRMEKCPGGTIPKFDEGCVPVGIGGCAEVFIEDDGHCRPSMDKCPDGTYALPLEGCVPIDGPDGCGTGTWGNIADGPNTVWVDGAHVGTQSGTQADPFTTIGQAVAAVPDGGRIAVAAGSYVEWVLLDKPVHLVGRCPTMVSLTSTGTSTALGTLQVEDTGAVRVEGLSIHGTRWCMAVEDAQVEVDTVRIHDCRYVGLYASGATTELDLHHVQLEQMQMTDNPSGLHAEQGVRASLQACAFVDNARASISIMSAGTELTMTGSLVQGTIPNADGVGFGVHVMTEAVAEIRSTAIVDNGGVGLDASGEGTTMVVHESLLARGVSQQVGTVDWGGQGALAKHGATVELTSVVVEDHAALGVAATNPVDHDAPSELTVAASLIQRTQPLQGLVGAAVGAQTGTQVSVTDTVAFQNHYAGLVAIEGDTRLQISGSLVESVAPQDDGEYGVGILVDGSDLEMSRCAIADVRVAGIVVGRRPGHPQPTGLLDEIMIENVPAGVFSTVDIHNQVVETHHDVGDGIVTTESANTELSRVFVRDVIRAAVLYHESLGSMTHVVGHADQFGLVLQGAAQPTWEAEQVGFTGDDRDVVTDGHLAVPTAPP